MKINKATSIILLLLVITSLLYLHFITYRNCQTFKIFKATLDFGTEHVRGCFSQYAIQKNIRHYVKTYVSKWSSEPIKNPRGARWVQDQLKLRSIGVKK